MSRAKQLLLPSGAVEFAIGPFESDDPQSDAAWWAGHEVELRQLAREQQDDSSVVAVIRVLKATPL
jgi:hypothetical protein